MAVEPTELRELSEGRDPADGLVSGTVGDRCVNCGSALSSDQRYCVVCGERRGAARFALPAPAAAGAEVAPPPRPPRGSRVGSGTTLVAGVATLLLAMLVGVLIGHNTAGSGTKTITAGPTKIIRINSGAAAVPSSATTPASTATTGAGSGSKASSGAHHGAKKAATPKKAAATIPKKTAQQESSAANKVTGGTHAAPSTSTVGSACAAGSAGCNKKGKFDGSFFGGG